MSGNEKCTGCSASLVGCCSMSLKAQLDACRREYEADAEPQVVDAARRSIRALAETGLVAKAVKAGETARLFRLRCGRGGFIDLSDLLNRGPVVVSFFWGAWCPFCVLELQALAAAQPVIERLGATLVALSRRRLEVRRPLPAVTANRRFLYCKILGARSRHAIASPLPSQSDSGPRTWRWATPIRRRPDRKVGYCRYPPPTSSIAPALSCFPTSMPTTPRGWSRPRSLLR